MTLETGCQHLVYSADCPRPRIALRDTLPVIHHVRTLIVIAVTAGSFTAWTEPSDPRPDEDYVIVIEVKLPAAIKSLDKSDLAGVVIGTDGWRQPIGRSALAPDAVAVDDFGATVSLDTLQEFYFDPGVAHLEVSGPGAVARVHDTIEVSSRVLAESQRIVIEF